MRMEKHRRKIFISLFFLFFSSSSAAPSPASAWTRLAPGDVAIDIERRGFDRLREAGFSAEDVDEMRQQFHMARPYLANAGL